MTRVTIAGRSAQASELRPRSAARWAVYGLLIGILNFTFTTCMCGHHSLVSVPFAVASIGMLAVAAAARGSLPVRLLVLISLIILGFLFAKIAWDVLWTGHDPFFGAR